MKQLQLDLNKRLLIVEFDDYIIKKYGLKGYADKVLNSVEIENRLNELTGGDPSLGYKLICIGPELTEDIANGLVDGFDLGYFVDYYHPNPRAYKLTALESFISAIESKEYYWNLNPVSLERERVYRKMGDTFNADGILRAWQEAESRTFNPSKCIIFEILKP